MAGIPKLWLEIQVDAHGQIILKGLLLLHLVFISGGKWGKSEVLGRDFGQGKQIVVCYIFMSWIIPVS